MQVFSTFRILMALLGPFWRLLGRSWAQSSPPQKAQRCSKSCPTNYQKMNKIRKRNAFLFEVQNGPQNCFIQRSRPTVIFGWAYLKSSCFQGGPEMAPRSAQNSHRCPRDGPKMAPTWIKMLPRRPQETPRWPQDTPK